MGTPSSPYRFSTKEWDEKSGLYYFGARYYSPEIGRWTQRDPAGGAGTENLYHYGAGEPVGNTDAWGMVVNKKNFSYGRTGEFDIVAAAEPRGRVSVEIWFKPSPDLCCDRIRIIQVAWTEECKGWWDLWNTHVAKPKWHKDPLEEWSDYVRGSRDWQKGHHAEAGDRPGTGSALWAHQEFETCAVCLKGDLKGWYLGCRKWSFEIAEGRVVDGYISGVGRNLTPEAPEHCHLLYTEYHAP